MLKLTEVIENDNYKLHGDIFEITFLFSSAVAITLSQKDVYMCHR